MSEDKSIDKSIANFDEECDASLGPASCNKSVNPIKTSKKTVFYDDPNAEPVLREIDRFSEEFMASFYDPKHIFHTTINKTDRLHYFREILAHQSLRLKLDYSKQRYYHPATDISNDSGPGFNETTVPTYN